LIQNISKGIANGLCQAFDSSGHLASEIFYKDGEIHGAAKFYFETKLVRTSTYKNGLLDGVSTDIDRDGNIIQKSTYVNNILEGPLIRYWPNGEIMEKIIYNSGVPTGSPNRFDQKGRKIQGAGAADTVISRLEKMVRGENG
jgi:antitoxin component YwqK of YwqJK toxin-antitoxin module